MGQQFSFHPISSTCRTETAYTIPTGVFALYSMLMVISGGFAGVVIARVVLRRICKWAAPATSIARLIEYLVSQVIGHIYVMRPFPLEKDHDDDDDVLSFYHQNTGVDCRND